MAMGAGVVLVPWSSIEVTKFKTLTRRARSSRQAQLRQMKEELSEFLQGDDDDVAWMLDCRLICSSHEGVKSILDWNPRLQRKGATVQARMRVMMGLP